ncbi:hypothetical protein D1BOALGB6SA_1598 [Olavius sp. associated proteobacterium Delta 1]|nr:hypothetical protein D1BOALGB6SA_1598 [Olavius sp. associated proteobacterium Delta 1]
MDNIVIIADDLTGAADTAVQFCPFFDDTRLVSYQLMDRILEPALHSSSRATALFTNSRALATDAANHCLVSVAKGLAREKSAWIYKKIDSCMRGNVGSEVDALLDELNYEVSFITPAFPEMGRTTHEDIHLVHGIPLSQSEISRDPITPVKESRLSLIVQSQSRHSVGHVGLNFLGGSQNHLIEEVERQLLKGVRHIVFDATYRDHLDRIAELIFLLEHKILPVGSAGLAGSIAKRLTSKPASDGPEMIFAPEGFNLLVCGTTSAVTGQQIDKLLESYPYEVIQLNPMLLADQNRKDEFSETASSARSGLLNKNVILTIKSQQNSRNTPRQTNLQPAADSIVRGLGLFVAEVAAAAKPGHLFLTGGDTADAVLTAIEAEGIRILGEVVAGVVQGAIMGGLLDGLPVVTKAGAFGQKDTLVVLHEFWQGLCKGSEVQEV